MRKLTAAMLAVAMLMCCLGTAMADDLKTFDTGIDSYGLSAKEWCSNSFYRALLTVSVALEYSVKVDNGKELSLGKPSFVAREDTLLTVCLPFEDGSAYMIFMYDTSIKTSIGYNSLDTGSSTLIREVAKEMAEESYENDTEDILYVLNMMKEILNNN